MEVPHPLHMVGGLAAIPSGESFPTHHPSHNLFFPRNDNATGLQATPESRVTSQNRLLPKLVVERTR
jgi:hypothetical protein